MRGSAPSIAPSSNDLRQELKLARFDRGSYATRRSSALPAPTRHAACHWHCVRRRNVARTVILPCGRQGRTARRRTLPMVDPQRSDVPSWSLMVPCHCASDACPFRRPLCEWPLRDRADQIGETEDEPDKQKAAQKSSAPDSECESPKPRYTLRQPKSRATAGPGPINRPSAKCEGGSVYPEAGRTSEAGGRRPAGGGVGGRRDLL